jgi:hypothetical protein
MVEELVGSRRREKAMLDEAVERTGLRSYH